jgi:hypothetical protein
LLCHKHNTNIATLSSILRGDHKVLLTSEDKENLLDRHVQQNSQLRQKQQRQLGEKRCGRRPKLDLKEALEIRRKYSREEKPAVLMQQYDISPCIFYKILSGEYAEFTYIMEEEGESDRNECFPELKSTQRTYLSVYEQELWDEMQ